MSVLKIPRSRRLTIGLAAVALFAAACGSTSTTETAETTPTDADPSAQTAPSTEAPSSGLVVDLALDGGQLEWNSLEGTDAVLWFWAPW